MGLLSGFVGGAAKAAGQVADQRISRYSAEMVAEQRDLAEQAKEARIEEMYNRRDAAAEGRQVSAEGRQAAAVDKARTGAVSRVDAASEIIADERVAQTRAQVEAGIPNRSAWTPEQQAAVDQSLALDRKGLIGASDVREQAARNTGDITPQQAASADAEKSRLEAANKRVDAQDASTNRRLDITEAWNKKQDEIRNRLAGIQEARLSRMEGKEGARLDKAELNSNRQALQSVLKDIGTQEDKLQVLAAGLLDPAQKDVIQKQLKSLDADRVAARNHLLSLSGVDPQKAGRPEEQDPIKAAMDAERAKREKKKTAEIKPNGLLETNPARAEVDPPDSPAGKFKENQARLKGNLLAKKSEAKDRAKELMANGTPQEIDAFQRSAMFNSLDAEEKAAVFQRTRQQR